MERHFLKYVHAQNLQYPAKTFVNSMNFIETGHHEVDADRDPDLRAHGVLASTVKGLNAEVLLDPFEEQLDLPAAFVDGRDGYGGQAEMVGQKDESLSRFSVYEANTPKRLRIVPFSFCGAQANDLIASQSGRLVHWTGLENVEARVLFAPDDEVGTGLFNPKEAFEIEVSPVEHIDAASFEKDLVEEVHVMDRPLGNTHEYGDGTGQVDLRVQLDGGLGCSESGPREHGEAKVDGGGIDGVDQLIEVQSVGVARVQSAGLADENLGERLIDPPVPALVRVGEIGAGNVTTKSHCVEMGAASKACLDVPKAFPKGDLREDHGEELVSGGHGLADTVHGIKVDAALKLFAVNQIGDLCENQASSVHSLLRMMDSRIRQPVQMRDTCFLSLTVENQIPTKF